MTCARSANNGGSNVQCPSCGYPDTKDGQHFKGIYEIDQRCPHCGYTKGVMYTAEEREMMLAKMKQASEIFYALAQQTRVHQFLEVTGFLNELIKVYKGMHDKGIDFGTQAAIPATHEMAYIAEKIDCIFGDALAVPELRKAFMDSLAQKGGWSWR